MMRLKLILEVWKKIDILQMDWLYVVIVHLSRNHMCPKTNDYVFKAYYVFC